MLERCNNTLKYLGHGVIMPKLTLSTAERLAYLSLELRAVLEEHSPNLVSIEETFCGINPLTNIRLGLASGALMAICGMAGIPVHQYASTLVKHMVAESGRASKIIIQEKVMSILNIDKTQYLDSTDALAVAIAYTILNPTKDELILNSVSLSSAQVNNLD